MSHTTYWKWVHLQTAQWTMPLVMLSDSTVWSKLFSWFPVKTVTLINGSEPLSLSLNTYLRKPAHVSSFMYIFTNVYALNSSKQINWKSHGSETHLPKIFWSRRLLRIDSSFNCNDSHSRKWRVSPDSCYNFTIHTQPFTWKLQLPTPLNFQAKTGLNGLYIR